MRTSRTLGREGYLCPTRLIPTVGSVRSVVLCQPTHPSRCANDAGVCAAFARIAMTLNHVLLRRHANTSRTRAALVKLQCPCFTVMPALHKFRQNRTSHPFLFPTAVDHTAPYVPL